jgi:ribose 5-phosphate isomerase B
MKIYFGADHNGFALKGQLIDYLKRNGYEVEDDGDTELSPEDDFPQFASKVVLAIKASTDSDPRGVLICGSGQGMCMAANRHKGIRACLCESEIEVQMSRNDDDANVLCLPARLIQEGKAERLLQVFLDTGFAGAARFKRRIAELDQLS